jgi:hypothetical protein
MRLFKAVCVAALVAFALSNAVMAQKKKATAEVCAPPNVSLASASPVLRLACKEGGPSYCSGSSSEQIPLTATVTDVGGPLTYKYSATGGRIVGEGTSVVWDLSGASPGRYSVTVVADNNCGCTGFATTTVVVDRCPACPACPTVAVAVTTPEGVREGTPVIFRANLTGAVETLSPVYNWSVTSGTITSGQGTPSITVDSTGLGGQSLTASVNLAGLPPQCGHSASTSFSFPQAPPPQPTRFDQYPEIRFNDEKARLDNFAIQLQNLPGASGYILIYTGRKGGGSTHANRAKDYLVSTRGIDAARVVVVDGGCRQEMMVELWEVPTGATPPAVDSTLSVPCGPGGGTHRRTRRYR